MVGQKFFRLLIIEVLSPKKYLVLCDCGKKKEIFMSKIKSGRIKSCGCYNLELIRLRGLANLKHGNCRRIEPRSNAYKTWASMIRRCHTKSASGYYKYGAKGVTVCNEWRNSFESFLNDMGEKPFPGASIDRIDNSKGYFKENCKWSTVQEQARNKTTNKFFTIDGVTKCIAEWVEINGLCYGTVFDRLKKGCDIKTALSKKRLKKLGHINNNGKKPNS